MLVYQRVNRQNKSTRVWQVYFSVLQRHAARYETGGRRFEYGSEPRYPCVHIEIVACSWMFILAIVVSWAYIDPNLSKYR